MSSLSILFAALFTLIWNNISDLEIDKISNPTRPLVTQSISLGCYKKISYGALALSLFFAFEVNPSVLLLVSTAILLYFLYTQPPVRFKRIPVISKLAISFNSLIAVLLGYFLLTHEFTAFPVLLIPIYLIGLTLAANVIDLKDIEGDRACGIKTLPVLIGNNLTKLIICLGFLIVYVGFYMLCNDNSWQNKTILMLSWLSLIKGLTQEPYQDKKIFLIFLSYTVLIITYNLVTQVSS